MARLSWSNSEIRCGILAQRSAAAVRARAVLHSNPRAHLPPFQPRRVRRIRKRDFGYLISLRLGRRNCRCRPKTAKARDPAHSGAFVNLRVALSHKSIRRLMTALLSTPQQTSEQLPPHLGERLQLSDSEAPWNDRHGRYPAAGSSGLKGRNPPQPDAQLKGREWLVSTRSRTFSTQSDGDCPLRPRVPAPGSAPVCHGVPPLCYRPGRELDRYRS